MRNLFVLSFFVFLSLQSSGQIVFVKETSHSSDTLRFDPFAIVDINGRLEVMVNRDSLLLKLSDRVSDDPALVSKLKSLNRLLVNQVEILKLLEDSIETADHERNLKKLGDYSVLMNEFYNKISADEKLRADANALFTDYFNLAPEVQRSHGSPEKFVVKQLVFNKNELSSQIAASESFAKVNVRLVAFLKTKGENKRQVHIKNFDNLAEGEFFEVDRWVTSFSEENMQAFEQNRVLASTLNRLASANFKQIEDVLQKNITSYGCFQQLVEKNLSLLSNIDQFVANNAAIRSFLSETQKDVNRITELLTSIRNIENELASENVVQLFNNKKQEFVNVAVSTTANLKSRILALPSAVSADPKISALNVEITTCLAKLNDDVEAVKNVVGLAQNILLPFMKSATEVKELGNEVMGFTVDQLPETGYIDLKTIGKRDNGDEVTIELIVNYDKDKTNDHGVTIEQKLLTLQQVKIYSITNVNVIAASPISNKANDNVALDNKFQFSPSGSLLFKVGSRKFPGWNFVSPGLGFNMSTPDFDLDGTPDFAAGGILTLFQDVLSFGISYNTKTDSSLWFFGLSLPFSGINLPINNIQVR